MDRINYNHLFYFYVVAKEGSIKEASEKIHVTQPTISDQLKLLEEFFECPLFERKNRGLYLNKQGEVVLDYAEKIFSLGQEIKSKVRNKILAPKKSLDIGISNYMSQYFLYEYLRPLFNQHETAVNFKHEHRRYLLADLEEGVLDVIFTDSKESLSYNLDAYKVGVNRTFAVAHKKFKNHKANFPSCLNEIPYFGYTANNNLKYEIELFFRKHAIAPKQLGQADDIDLFQMVTEEGFCFTIVPEVAMNRFKRNKDIIVLGEIKELQTSVWGIIKHGNDGLAYQLVNGKL